MPALLAAVRDSLAGVLCQVYLRPCRQGFCVVATRGDWGAVFPIGDSKLDDPALGWAIGRSIAQMLNRQGP